MKNFKRQLKEVIATVIAFLIVVTVILIPHFTIHIRIYDTDGNLFISAPFWVVKRRMYGLYKKGYTFEMVKMFTWLNCYLVYKNLGPIYVKKISEQ